MDFQQDFVQMMERQEKEHEENTAALFIRVYQGAYRQGLVAAVGRDEWHVLQAISMFMNSKGIACPSITTLADIIGCSRPLVIKCIQKLLAFKWNGKPIIVGYKKKTVENWDKWYFRILPLSQIAVFDGEMEPLVNYPNDEVVNCIDRDGKHYLPGEETALTGTVNGVDLNNISIPNTLDKKELQVVNSLPLQEDVEKEIEFKAAKDVIGYFCKTYYKTYQEEYIPNYGRDGKQIKDKLLCRYSSKELKDIIDTTFKVYEREFKTSKYTRPTLGALYTWIPNKVIPYIKEDVENQKRYEIAIEEQEHSGTDVLFKLLDKRKRIDKERGIA